LIVLYYGGGAFLIPYFIAMFTCGIPLFLLEVSIGQYLRTGGMNVIGQICPIFKGVGYSAIMMVFLENVYYVIIVAWTMFYIANIFYNIGDDLPWTTCEQGNGTWANSKCFNPEGNITFNQSDAFLKHGLSENLTESPVEQYWNNKVLDISSGIDDVGGLRWELVAYLAIAWITVYFVVWKGLHNSGKVMFKPFLNILTEKCLLFLLPTCCH
jgi:SNF family Na+-dependent transporter